MDNQNKNECVNQINSILPVKFLGDKEKENNPPTSSYKPSLLRKPKLIFPPPQNLVLSERNQKNVCSSGPLTIKRLNSEDNDDGCQKKENKTNTQTKSKIPLPMAVFKGLNKESAATGQPKMKRRTTVNASIRPMTYKSAPGISHNNKVVLVKQCKPSEVSKLCKTSKIRKTEEQKGIINADPHEIPTPTALLYNLEYLEENLVYLLDREKVWNNSYKYSLRKMTCVSTQSRAVIVNWLLIVKRIWRSNMSAFFTGVRLFDIMIQLNFPLDKIQLMGTICMWVAHKNLAVDGHEIKCNDLKEICKDAATTEEVITIEKQILRTCDFFINIPDPLTFLAIYILRLKTTSATLVYTYAKYLLEVVSLDVEFCANNSSKLAAGAVKFALEILHEPYDWDLLRGKPGFYEKDSLHQICRKMVNTLKLVQDPHFSCNYVYRKFNCKKYLFLSDKIKKMRL